MIPPGQKRIIDIDITNRCDILRCSNCTRGLLYQKERVDMTLLNFQAAVESLADWVKEPPVQHGWVSGGRVIALIGGNPTLHPQFEEICQIFKTTIPKKDARGLWTNNLMGHGGIIRDCFGAGNWNVHGDQNNLDEMRKADPRHPVFGVPHPKHRDPLKQKGYSLHGGIFTAIQDFVGTPEIPDESAMWAAIEDCDFNKYWSGSIQQMPDEKLYCYFCEQAATLEAVYWFKPDWKRIGIPLERGWWKWGMDHSGFDNQHKTACRQCGIPSRIKGHADREFIDDFSETHRGLIETAIKRQQKHRLVSIDTPIEHAVEISDYSRQRT